MNNKLPRIFFDTNSYFKHINSVTDLVLIYNHLVKNDRMLDFEALDYIFKSRESVRLDTITNPCRNFGRYSEHRGMFYSEYLESEGIDVIKLKEEVVRLADSYEEK